MVTTLESARAESDRALSGFTAAQLERSTVWSGYDVDVRFRLYRFAAHVVEHTIQCEKILAALAQPETEARRLVRVISATRGAHERRTPPETLSKLDASHLARVASL